MTLQEIHDKIKAHLLAQGRPAWSTALISCAYRADDGKGGQLMCAVGCLIKDDVYARYERPGSSLIEGRRVSHLHLRRALADSGIEAEEGTQMQELLSRWQRVHDDAADGFLLDEDNRKWAQWIHDGAAEIASELNINP